MPRASSRPIYDALQKVLQGHFAANPKQLLEHIADLLEQVEQEKTDEWLKHSKQLGLSITEARHNRKEALIHAASTYAARMEEYLVQEADAQFMQKPMTEQWVILLQAAVEEDQLPVLSEFFLEKALGMMEEALQQEVNQEIEDFSRRERLVAGYPLIRQLLRDRIYAYYYALPDYHFSDFAELITRLLLRRHMFSAEIVAHLCSQDLEGSLSQHLSVPYMQELFIQALEHHNTDLTPAAASPTEPAFPWETPEDNNVSEKDPWDFPMPDFDAPLPDLEDSTDTQLEDTADIQADWTDILPADDTMTALESPMVEPEGPAPLSVEEQFFIYVADSVEQVALEYAALRALSPPLMWWQLLGIVGGLFFGAVAGIIGMVCGSIVGMYLGAMAGTNQYIAKIDAEEAAALSSLLHGLMQEYESLHPAEPTETNLHSGDGTTQLPQETQTVTQNTVPVDQTRLSPKDTEKGQTDSNIVLSYFQDQIGLAIDSKGWYLTVTQPGLDDLVEKIAAGDQAELLEKFAAAGHSFQIDTHQRFTLLIRDEVVTTLMQQLDRAYPIAPIKETKESHSDKELLQAQGNQKVTKKGV